MRQTLQILYKATHVQSYTQLMYNDLRCALIIRIISRVMVRGHLLLLLRNVTHLFIHTVRAAATNHFRSR